MMTNIFLFKILFILFILFKEILKNFIYFYFYSTFLFCQFDNYFDISIDDSLFSLSLSACIFGKCETESTISSSSRAINQLPSCFTIDQSWNFPKGFLRLVVACFLFLFLFLSVFFGNLSPSCVTIWIDTVSSNPLPKKHRYRSQCAMICW